MTSQANLVIVSYRGPALILPLLHISFTHTESALSVMILGYVLSSRSTVKLNRH